MVLHCVGCWPKAFHRVCRCAMDLGCVLTVRPWFSASIAGILGHCSVWFRLIRVPTFVAESGICYVSTALSFYVSWAYTGSTNTDTESKNKLRLQKQHPHLRTSTPIHPQQTFHVTAFARQPISFAFICRIVIFLCLPPNVQALKSWISTEHVLKKLFFALSQVLLCVYSFFVDPSPSWLNRIESQGLRICFHNPTMWRRSGNLIACRSLKDCFSDSVCGLLFCGQPKNWNM